MSQQKCDIAPFEHNKAIFHIGQCHSCFGNKVIDYSETQDVQIEPSGQGEEGDEYASANSYAAECIGDYSPELQQDFDDVRGHFIAGVKYERQQTALLSRQLKGRIKELENILRYLYMNEYCGDHGPEVKQLLETEALNPSPKPGKK